MEKGSESLRLFEVVIDSGFVSTDTVVVPLSPRSFISVTEESASWLLKKMNGLLMWPLFQ